MKLKNLKKDTKVKIESKGEYLLLMDLAEKAGYKWNNGEKPTYFNDNCDYFNTHGIKLYDDMTIRHMHTYRQADTDAVSLKKVIKFEVGDKVRIRKDLDKCDSYESPLIVSDMLDYAGNVYEIEHISLSQKQKRYRLKCGYSWLKKWIEPVLPEVEEEIEPVFEDGKFYKFDYEKYCQVSERPAPLDKWPGKCDGKIVKVSNEKYATCGSYGIYPKWCVEVDLKVGDFVKITNNTMPIHNFPIGQIVEVKDFHRKNRLSLEGYCEDRKSIDWQIVSVEDIQIC